MESSVYIETLVTGSTELKGKISLQGALPISNLGTGGSIGSAASTVDVSPGAMINQTTTGQTLTLPSPTLTTEKALFTVVNVGTASFSLMGIIFYPGTGSIFEWTGSIWAPLDPAATIIDMATVNITNKATGGSIGSAASTVDIAGSFNVNQTTAGQTLTVPNPTNATVRKIITVNNTGSTPFTLFGITIAVGAGAIAQWNGTGWSSFSNGSGGGASWNLGGNTVGVAQNFGTIDNFDLPIVTNNTEKMRVSAAGSVGVNTNAPSSLLKMDINGAIGLRANPSAFVTTPGPTAGVNPGAYSVLRVNGVGPQTIAGISGGVDGRVLIIINEAPTILAISDNDTVNEPTAANRIHTGNNDNMFVGVRSSTLLVYDGTLSRWVVLNSNLMGISSDTTTALGQSALLLNNAPGNTGLGVNCLATNVTGSFNTAAGFGALAMANASDNNSAFGYDALNANTLGAFNSAFGMNAAKANTGGSNNSAFGAFALTNVNASDNSAFGTNALTATTVGTGCSAFGSSALAGNTLGIYNTAMGATALLSNTTGVNNTAVGRDALRNNTTGFGNTAVGYGAGNGGGANWNSSLGANSLANATSGGGNTAVGAFSLNTNNSGTSNTATGYSCLSGNTTGNNNVASGNNSMLANTTGGNNSAYGATSFSSNTSGNNNCAFGYGSLSSSSITDSSNAFGYNAARQSSAANNCSFGTSSMNNTTTGGNNCAFGNFALSFITTGTDNIAVGYNAGNGATNASSNNIYVGSNGAVENNTTRIGSTQTRAFVAGVSGVTTAGAAVAVLVDNQGQLGTISSSIRYKNNVQDMGRASSAIYDLRPVTFNYIADKEQRKQYGLIAEEVDKVLPDMVVRDRDGNIQTVQYHLLVPMLLNEIISLRKEIDRLR